MRRFALFIVAIILCSAIAAQGLRMDGRVRVTTNLPAAGATVILMAGNDPARRQTACDSSGHFNFEKLGAGKYTLQVSMIGYRSYTQDNITLISSHPTLQLPDIVLTALKNELAEVTVSAQKNFLEQKADRTVVNVNAMISNTGANALEVLEKTPGIIVDENGNVIFKGKSGVIILIDDKPTYLSGDNLVNYLKSLPASELDKIELMPTPPARYDASGNSGVINIRTKKSTAKGFNGSIAASIGKAKYWRTLESISLNYHESKWNLFANAGVGVQNNYRRLDVGRTYFDNAGKILSSYTETAFFHPVNYNQNFKMGFDYSASPKTSLGAAVTGLFSPGHNTNPTNSVINGPGGATDSLIIADNHTTMQFGNIGINLNWAQKFSKPGQLLTMDLDYLQYNASRDQSFMNNTYNASGILTNTQTLTDQLPALIHIYAAKSDYSQNLGGKARIEAGVKASFVNTDNEANYFNIIGGNSQVDYGKTNRFLYDENINAAYLSYNNEWKRFSIKAGLRIENSNIDAHQLGNAVTPDSAFAQHYTNLFPTAYLSYKLDTGGRHTLNLSYGKRIDRPSYQNLNPFTNYVDKYSTWVGNPFLRPQFASAFQLVYSYKSIFSATLQYTYIKDFQSEVDLQEGNLFVAHTLNIGHSINKGLSLYLGLPLNHWWSFNWNTEIINNAYTGQIPGKFLETDMTYFYSTMTHTFTFSNGWSAELSGFYISKGQYGQFIHNTNGQVNTGFQKKILHGKGALKLGLRDILGTNINGGLITNIPNVAATYRNDNAQRSLTLGFTYTFGSSTNDKKTNTGSAETEQNRVRL